LDGFGDFWRDHQKPWGSSLFVRASFAWRAQTASQPMWLAFI
jgi:hypothetical protein